jgi:type II secretory pathway pseudopilin PulG
MARGERTRRGARGFTYVGLLALVVLIGIMLAAAGEVASTAAQREREAQLLWVGHEYRAAIGRYFNQRRAYPQTLQELIGNAPDTAVPVRYIRRLYPDPMTNAVDWVLVPAPGGGIMGVASSSKRAPRKTSNFEEADKGFENAAAYSDWPFTFAPRVVPPQPAAKPAASRPSAGPGVSGQGTTQSPSGTSAAPWGSRNRTR